MKCANYMLQRRSIPNILFHLIAFLIILLFLHFAGHHFLSLLKQNLNNDNSFIDTCLKVINVILYLHHARVSHGADVSEFLLIVGNLLENSPHDFPGSGLGQPRCGLDEVRGSEGGDLLPDHRPQLGLYLGVEDAAFVQGDEAVESFPLKFKKIFLK